jgi:hypothetical protein
MRQVRQRQLHVFSIAGAMQARPRINTDRLSGHPQPAPARTDEIGQVRDAGVQWSHSYRHQSHGIVHQFKFLRNTIVLQRCENSNHNVDGSARYCRFLRGTVVGTKM